MPTPVAASSAPARVAARSRPGAGAGAATVFLWSTIAFTARLLGPVPRSDARPGRDTPIRPTDLHGQDLRPRPREWAGQDGDRGMPAIGTGARTRLAVALTWAIYDRSERGVTHQPEAVGIEGRSVRATVGVCRSVEFEPDGL